MCPSLSRSALVARTTPQQPSRPTPAGEADGGIEMQSPVCRNSAAPPVSMCMNTQQPCALWDRQCALSFVSCRLQQSLVPQTRGARGGEPIERHVGSYLSAFFRLLGESVCVACRRGSGVGDCRLCGCSRKSLCLCFIATRPLLQKTTWSRISCGLTVVPRLPTK